ncbi:PfkB family carbohydrate kinase [Gallaecimonas sp. GXIMD4217]|uniref:PfkB family carbohydrate kinase n=1 Tax=Gallaecimonas sp. GXIMD4217 TaxID=3131927 RepID=UPI00311B30AB
MTEREQQILDLIRTDPLIPQQQLADRLGISRSAVAGHIMHLTQKGYIQGKGYILAPERFAAVLGGANMDLAGQADGELRLQDSNPGRLSASPGGVARNVAENLARLGSRVELISALGQDDWGERLIQSCRLAGVGTEHCLRLAGQRSSTYLSLHDADGEMQLALNDMAILERLDSQALEARVGLLERAGLWVLDANLGPDALSWLFSRAGNKPVLVDTVSAAKAARFKPYLGQIHTLKPNRLEAEVLTGLNIAGPAEVERAVAELHGAGVQRVLLSLGADGAYASECGQGFWLDTVPVQVANVTGAGDAAMAALAHGLLNDRDWRQSCELAMAASALAASAADTIHPLMSEAALGRVLEENHA